MPSEEDNTWTQWSVHVLKELERLNIGQTEIAREIHNIKNSAAQSILLESKIKEVQEWKSALQEIASVSQIQDFHRSINDLVIFKEKAVMIWVVVNALLTVSVAVVGFLSIK